MKVARQKNRRFFWRVTALCYYDRIRLLGIDYGTKRIGLALSDEAGRFAMPHSVLPNTKDALTDVADLCEKEQIQTVVIGESSNYDSTPNPIMADIKTFATALAEKTKCQIVFEPEFYTSQEAQRIIGKDNLFDARAAALILKSYIDKQFYV